MKVNKKLLVTIFLSVFFTGSGAFAATLNIINKTKENIDVNVGWSKQGDDGCNPQQAGGLNGSDCNKITRSASVGKKVSINPQDKKGHLSYVEVSQGKYKVSFGMRADKKPFGRKEFVYVRYTYPDTLSHLDFDCDCITDTIFHAKTTCTITIKTK